MNTYRPPALTAYGSVEELTGVVGSKTGTDVLVVNGTALEQNNDFTTIPDGSCYFSLRGSIGQLTYLEGQGRGGEEACTDYFLDNYYND